MGEVPLFSYLELRTPLQGPTAMLKDTVKLKRLMANVCERLAAR